MRYSCPKYRREAQIHLSLQTLCLEDYTEFCHQTRCQAHLQWLNQLRLRRALGPDADSIYPLRSSLQVVPSNLHGQSSDQNFASAPFGPHLQDYGHRGSSAFPVDLRPTHCRTSVVGVTFIKHRFPLHTTNCLEASPIDFGPIEQLPEVLSFRVKHFDLAGPEAP